MPVRPRNDPLLYEVAEMYYEHGITQAEAARRLGLTTMAISRMLKAARDRGIASGG
jgi:DNA-binding transcriptional regulator LsrR (DeoR family)